MPLYEYECQVCKSVIEQFNKISDIIKTLHCDNCDMNQPVKKLISKSSFKLEGEGWAKDGYAKQRMEKFEHHIKE